MTGISMKGKSLVVFGAMLMLAACSNDFTESQQRTASDFMADYDGPLSVNISMAGNVTRTENIMDKGTDAYFGDYAFPRTVFTQEDAVGILHVLKRGNEYQVLNYKAVTTDGGTTWTVQDTDGNAAVLRYYGNSENYYYAYSPYVDVGLNENDYLLSKLEEAGGQEVSAYEFFEPKVNATIAAYDDQSNAAKYTACDFLGAKGVCTPNNETKTASLEIHLDHLLALDIVKLKKWDGKVTIYGAYDTWVAPNNTIWRMKQRLQPVVAEAFSGEVTPKVDGILDKWYVYDADTCQFYMRLVKPGVEQKRFGNPDLAKNGGWLVDIPAVPSGQYVLLSMPYFRFFREKGFNPTEDNQAGTTWRNEWETYFSTLMPYTWTYEDILFDNSDVRYDYDEVLEVGNQLLEDGNISKTAAGVGTVKWIAYAPQPWLSTPGFYLNHSRFFYRYYIENPERFADNGYRPKGCEIETNSVKHLGVDYAAHGYATLDDFWATDICNHFIAFNNSVTTYKPNSSDITHDDAIFSLAQPVISYSEEFGLYRVNAQLIGYYPYTWTFMSPEWHLNTDGTSGIRSNETAASANGPDKVAGTSWMVPTSAQYFIGHYPEETDIDYLTCNYLPEHGGNEGIISLTGNYSFMSSGDDEVVYFGNGFAIVYQMLEGLNLPSYGILPLAYDDIEVTKDRYDDDLTTPVHIVKDHLYINDDEDSSASVIAPPTIYRSCIIF